LVVGYTPCCNNYHVLSKVHSFMKINNHFPTHLMNIINLSKNWRAHLMPIVRIQINILHQSLVVVIISCKQFLPNCAFFKFNIISLIQWITEHVSKNIHRRFCFFFKLLSVIKGVLTAGVSIELRAFVFNISFYQETSSFLSTFKMEMFKKVGFARVCLFFMPTASADKNTNTRHLRFLRLRHDTDTIRNS